MISILLTVGKIIGPHALQGHMKVWSYMECPHDMITIHNFTVGTRYLESWSTCRPTGNPHIFIAKIEGVNDRNTAAQYNQATISISVDKPTPESECIYMEELLKKNVVDKKGVLLGKVHNFHNFGAGSLIEVVPGDESSLLQKNSSFMIHSRWITDVDAHTITLCYEKEDMI